MKKFIIIGLVLLFVILGCSTIPEPRGNTDGTINTSDTTPPTVSILSPTPGTKVGGIYSLHGLASDNNSGIDKVYYSINNGAFSEAPLNNSIFQVNISLTNYGEHTNYVYAVDKAGNTSSTQSVNIERAGIPAVVISSPINGFSTNVFAFPVNIAASVDYPATLTNIVLKVYGNDDLLKYTISKQVNSTIIGIILQANNLTLGSNLLIAYAYADNGQTAVFTNNIYIYDNIAPTVTPNPNTDFATNEAFTATLSVNENYGYWSTNGSSFVQFSSNDTIEFVVSNYLSLICYGADILGNTTSTQSVIYYAIYDEIVYVSTSGNDANDGKTIGNAVLSIQKAVELAKSYVYDNVVVEAGVYIQGAGLSNTVAGNNYAGVNIGNAHNIRLLGGWNSDFTAQTGYSELDGSGGTANTHIIYVQNTSNLTINGFVIRDASSHGAYFNGVTSSLIQNCVISNHSRGIYLSGNNNTIGGTISGNTAGSESGGGVYMGGSSNTISGTISGNTADDYGGGVYINGSYNTISGTISGNTAGGYGGGGVYINGSYNTISGTISGNTTYSDAGGGVYISSGSYNNISGTVSDNTACSGGGVGIMDSSYNTISGTVSGNTADLNGGGVYMGGSSNTISGTISGNTAGLYGGDGGGGVYMDGSYNTISGTISGNTAGSESGGGVYMGGSSNTISGTISGNTADDYGGGVYIQTGSYNTISGTISNNTANLNGGGIRIYSGSHNVISGTVSNNFAKYYGGGVYMQSSIYNTISGSIISNTAGSYGGGVYFCDNATNNIFAATCEVKWNTVTGGSVGDGGGVYNNAGAGLQITNNGFTISDNDPDDWAGGAPE